MSWNRITTTLNTLKTNFIINLREIFYMEYKGAESFNIFKE